MKTNFSHNIQVVHSLTRLLLQTIGMVFLVVVLFAAIQGVSEVITKETQELAAQPTSEFISETNLFLPANLEVDSSP